MLFAQKAFEIFQNFQDEFEVDPEFHQVGYLFLATSQEELENFRKNVEFQNRFGVPVQVVRPEEIKKEWPYLNVDDVSGGAFCSTDGYAGPHEVTQAIAKAARRRGVDIQQETEAVSIEVDKNRIVSVTTNEGKVSTSTAVNAAGPYAASVGKMAGVDIPVKPIRRQIFVTEPFGGIPSSVPLTIDHGQNFYFRREGEAVLMSGPQDKEPSFKWTPDLDSIAETAEKATHRVPAFSESRIARGWAGLYEISPDKHAILGKVPQVEGLVLANGFSGHGFQHGPAAGMAIAELIVDGRAEAVDIEPLKITRFQDGNVIEETMTAFKD
jgi:sarcosine oxidase subunit beta